MPIDRRQALRVAAAAAVAGTAGCDHATARPASGGSAAVPATGGLAAPRSWGALPAEVTHGPRDRPDVALTFHGQGDPRLVGTLLQAIDTARVPVTVLAVGTWLAANPGIGRQILAAGHELGNHTQHHLAINQMPTTQARTEITACGQVLRTVTGSIGTWFRPSQGQHATSQLQNLTRQVGYPTCLSYDVDSLDYTDPPADTVVRQTLTHVQPGSIVSLHFGHPVTITALPRILDGLHTRGLRPVTVTDLLRP